MTPEIRHLRAFVTVAEELHFGRAAARLNIVQPALSMQIKGLETMLGVSLLHRTRRVVALTEPGRLFLEEASRILRQLDSAVDLAQRAGRGEAGRLTIGYSAATAHSGLLSRLVGAFHRTTPDVELLIRELHPALQREALLAGELDVGFVVADAASSPPEFERTVVETWQMVLALPAEHPLATHAVVPLSALRDERFISYSALGEDLGVDAFRAAAGFVPAVEHLAENPMMLLTLVGAGLGIATVPAPMTRGAPPGVAFVAVEPALPELPIVALARCDSTNAALARFVHGISNW
ncbi:LysR family transcriptional regulator [Sphingomonas sp. PL-96]|uniref:LysR substrate-binding domain-containing protein n=1 Tax=Sphingomonas sp. PL-96 TaxID=2887201 RepID=UPI001E41CE40|nr:LysR substrate-binding domain-containing protein [Sphingomonas sp. PL-96]MCC2976847.1 LysR family transcriptional regulator [Sphingomonas sp. PL-96]